MVGFAFMAEIDVRRSFVVAGGHALLGPYVDERVPFGAAVVGLVVCGVEAVNLSGRLGEIAVGAGLGMTAQGIADLVGVNLKTVKNSLTVIYAQVGVDSKPQLALALVWLGLAVEMEAGK